MVLPRKHCKLHHTALQLVKSSLGFMQGLLQHPANTTVSLAFNENITKNTVLAVCHWEGRKKLMAVVEERTCSQLGMTKYIRLVLLTNCT